MALYRVRLQYGIVVDAPSTGAAHEKVKKMLKDSPELGIAGVESATLAKPRSLLARLWTGK